MMPPLSSLLFSQRCRHCGRAMGSRSFLCRACVRLVLAARVRAPRDSLLPHEFPALLHCLREAAPTRSARFFFWLAVRAGWLDRWRGTELVVPAPRSRPPSNDGLALFAGLVARELGARARALIEKNGPRSQHGLDSVSRRDAPLFLRVAKGAEAEVRRRRVLFIDDVRTTGTTEDMAAYCLREAGAGAVSACALVGVPEMLEGFEREGGEPRDEREEVHPLLFHLTV